MFVTMQITFLTHKSALIYRRGLRQRVASLTLDCNGIFAIKACASDFMRSSVVVCVCLCVCVWACMHACKFGWTVSENYVILVCSLVTGSEDPVVCG